MFIGELATPEVVTISENASLTEAAQLMKEENVGSLVLLKDGQADSYPSGIITDRDLVIELLAEKVDPEKIAVKDLLVNDLMVVRNKSTSQEAVEAMVGKGVRRAPVVDEQDQLVGIVALDDLLIGIVEELYELIKIIKKQQA